MPAPSCEDCGKLAKHAVQRKGHSGLILLCCKDWGTEKGKPCKSHA